MYQRSYPPLSVLKPLCPFPPRLRSGNGNLLVKVGVSPFPYAALHLLLEEQSHNKGNPLGRNKYYALPDTKQTLD
jgi:hypothetical protein